MLFNELITDENRKGRILQAVDVLKQVGLPGALLDRLRIINMRAASATPMEHSALRAAFADGYTEALLDLFEFKERYFSVRKEDLKRMDFGAAQRLLESKEITVEEYNELIGKR